MHKIYQHLSWFLGFTGPIWYSSLSVFFCGCSQMVVLGLCLSQLRLLYNKYHRLDNLRNWHLFLTVLETETSEIKVPVDLGLGEGTLPGFVNGHLLALYFPWCVHMEREYPLSLLIRSLIPSFSSSSYKITDPIIRTPSLI